MSGVGPRRPRVDRAPGRAAAAHGEPAAGRVAPRGRRAHAAAGGLRRPPARRADVGRAACRSTVRARRRAGRHTSPSPTRTGSSRCCGRVLDNAVKYSPPGSPIDVAIDAQDGRARDHDPRPRRAAWTPATRERAFEQFYRSDQARDARARRQRRRPLRGPRPDARRWAARSRSTASSAAGTSVTLGIPAESSAEGVE